MPVKGQVDLYIRMKGDKVRGLLLNEPDGGRSEEGKVTKVIEGDREREAPHR